MDAPEPLDLVTTLNTLIAEWDYESYGYSLPGNKPQILGGLVANFFDLDQHAIALVTISPMEYLVTQKWDDDWGLSGPGNTTQLDPDE
jgi:hypothetical protein